MAVADVLTPFIWGAGGARKTPEEIARDREIAAAMMAQGVDTSPIGHWSQGAARVVGALGGVLKERRANKASETNAAESQSRIAKLLGGLGGANPTSQFPPAPVSGQSAAAPVDYASSRVAQAFGDAPGGDIRTGIIATAQALGIDPVDLATAISYETAGTFDPMKKGPTTQWGQHQGLIQFGEPQAQQYGVDWNNALGSQLGPDGAVAKYLKDTGVQPGMGLLDIYSAINAGGVGRYGASDANNGGAPGTVADKVNSQMAEHRQKAIDLLGAQQAAAAPQGSVPAPGGVPMPEMAGNAPQPVQMAQNGNNMQAIIEALSSPYASPQERDIAGILLKQAMTPPDPNAGLDAEYKRMQIKKLESDIATANSPDARKKFGLNPQYGVDAEGNPVLLQLGENGQAMQTALPPGVRLSKEPIRMDAGTHWVLLDPITRQPVGQVQKNVAGEAAATAGGKAQGEAQVALPQVEAGYQSAVEQIDQLMSHPGLNASVGTIQGQIPDSIAGALNSDVADFRTRLNQAKGQTFLRAFEALKGGGAITEIEGLKAEQAIGRLNQAVSETDFKTALNDLKAILDRGMDAYRRKAGVVSQPPDGWQDMGGGVRIRVKPQ